MAEGDLDENLVREISRIKGEPDWMRDFRLHAHEMFTRLPTPNWGGDMSQIDVAEIDAAEIGVADLVHGVEPASGHTGLHAELSRSVPLPVEASDVGLRNRHAGMTAQHESDVAYRKNRDDLEARGVVFADLDTAIREYPELVRSYLGTVIPSGDNRFAALNSAVWSGGSFIYVPPGVEVEIPLQARSRSTRQFERTLIVADEGARVHYIEGCSSPVYTSHSLHSAVVELVAEDHARISYTTIQNWSPSVFNVATKRAVAHEGAGVEWIEGNMGSRLTATVPAIHLTGPKASAEVLSVAYAGAGQRQNAGAEIVHAAAETTSRVVARSISKDGGHTTNHGLVRVEPDALGCQSHVRCEALLLDEESTSDTHRQAEIAATDAVVRHEQTLSRVATEQLFYLQSRGLTEEQAMGIVVNGFIEPVTKTLPVEFAVEWSRLIELQIEGAIG